MMNEPPELGFADKIRTGAYPTVEVGGIIWAYLGPPEQQPPLPQLRVDAGAADASPRLEGDPGVQLAAGRSRAASTPRTCRSCTACSPPTPRGPASSPAIRSCAARRPRWSSTSPTTATATPACGPSTTDELHVRAYHFILPFHQIRPRVAPARRRATSPARPATSGCRWMTRPPWSTTGSTARRRAARPRRTASSAALGNGPLDVDQTTFRSQRNRANDWLLDRARAADRDLHRHRRRQHAGPRGAGEHGADRRPHRRSIWAPPTAP